MKGWRWQGQLMTAASPQRTLELSLGGRSDTGRDREAFEPRVLELLPVDNLKTLNLHRSGIVDGSLPFITSVQHLILEETLATGLLLQILGCNYYDQKDQESMPVSFPNLRIMEIRSTRFTGDDFDGDLTFPWLVAFARRHSANGYRLKEVLLTHCRLKQSDDIHDLDEFVDAVKYIKIKTQVSFPARVPQLHNQLGEFLGLTTISGRELLWMSLIILLGYVLVSPSHAAPLPASGSSEGAMPDLGLDESNGLGEERESFESFITSTVLSCLFTILLSLWVSVHPNAPSARDSPKKRLRRRVELVLWALLVPELMVCWAVRQWFGARRLKKRYQAHGWTMTHGHFLQMGGWMVVRPWPSHQEGTVCTNLPPLITTRLDDVSSSSFAARQVLSPALLDWFLDIEVSADRRPLDLWTITPPASAIQAHSSSNLFTTFLAVIQVVWFACQCISKAVQPQGHARVLRIELVTASYVLMSLIMYVLWWSKPMDVRIHRKVKPHLASDDRVLEEWKRTRESVLSEANAAIEKQGEDGDGAQDAKDEEKEKETQPTSSNAAPSSGRSCSEHKHPTLTKSRSLPCFNGRTDNQEAASASSALSKARPHVSHDLSPDGHANEIEETPCSTAQLPDVPPQAPLPPTIPAPHNHEDVSCHRDPEALSQGVPEDADQRIAEAERAGVFVSLWGVTTHSYFHKYVDLRRLLRRCGDMILGPWGRKGFSSAACKEKLHTGTLWEAPGFLPLVVNNPDSPNPWVEEQLQKIKPHLPRCLPTFYAMPSVNLRDDRLWKVVAGSLATLFGAFLLAGWNSAWQLTDDSGQGSSHVFTLLWRISAMVVTVIPSVATFGIFRLSLDRFHRVGIVSGGIEAVECMLIFPTLFYIPARILLIALPVVELVRIGQGWERAYPGAIDAAIRWTQFILHVQ
ncbi:hypothetical protein BKA70DRAFT_1557035 [Coprinopsis sp. MPI-PUGE-AT-0042]|nr:hypothetical protein BKA70DRAFT_1557035 [Coprinopsis sp. MPI-PUGE-AT-0042]